MKKTIFYKFPKDLSLRYFVVYYWFTLLAFLFFLFLPFKLLGLILILAVTISGLATLIQENRDILSIHFLNIGLSGTALLYHWQWGFTLFGTHLEHYYCWTIFLVSTFSYVLRLIRLTIGKLYAKQKN